MSSRFEELRGRLLSDLPQEPPGRLPSVRRWAKRFGAGTLTVQVVLDSLVADGLLRKRNRSGYWRVEDFPTVEIRSTRTDSSLLAERLRQELRSGLFPWNLPLPSIKEWARRWNCQRRTAASVLERLKLEGLVVRQGRTFHPVVPRKASSTGSEASMILCVGAADPIGGLRMDSEREIDFWKELGAESARLGFALKRQAWDGGMVRLDRSTVGVVASTWHLPEPEGLFRALERTHKPVCIWIQDPEAHRSPAGGHRRLRFHDQGYGKVSGSRLAEHLVSRGHRRLAFLSPWHGSLWSRNRLRGLVEEASRHGVQVDNFCLDGVSEWDRLAPAWADGRIWKDFPTETIGGILEGPADRLREEAIRMLAWNRIRRDLEPLFEAALCSEATAWVGVNDACALLALEWLRARGEHRALAGFDDTAEALRADLTSFRFDSGAMVRSMLGQILSSREASGLTRHEGILVVRGSDRLRR